MKIMRVVCFLVGVFILFALVNFSSALDFNKPVALSVLNDNAFWEVRAVVDFNNDSVPDFLFQHHVTGKLSILFMNPDGTKNNTLAITSPNIVLKIRAIKDFNNDSIPDLIFQNAITGKVTVGITESNGTQNQISILNKTMWKLTNVADFNNDSIQDLIFQHAIDGGVIVWFVYLRAKFREDKINKSVRYVGKNDR